MKKLQREIARMNDTLAKLRQEENPKREGYVFVINNTFNVFF